MTTTRLHTWLCGFAAALASLSSQAATLPLGITNQPQSLSLYECQLATFNVGFTGTLFLTSWYRDGVLVSHNLPYSLPGRVTLSDNGAEFHVVLSNSLGSVTSSIATLTVTADPLPFRVASVKSCSGLDSLLVSFATYPLNPTNATNVLNYWLNGDTVVSSAVVNQGTNVLLTTLPRVEGDTYTLTVSDLFDSKDNLLSPNPTEISFVAGAGTDFTIIKQPASTNTSQGHNVTLQFAVQAASTCFGTNVPVTYQWQQRYVTNSFTNIVGATNSAYSFYAYTPFCWGGDVEYRALAFANDLVVTSATATVTAWQDDGGPPILKSAQCNSLISNRVTLSFFQLAYPVNLASATNPALYSINNGVTVLAANYGSSASYEIVLTTTPLTNGAFYLVTVTNIQGYCEFPPEQLAFINHAPVTLLGARYPAGHDYIYIEAEDFDFNTSHTSTDSWQRNINYSHDPLISGDSMGSQRTTFFFTTDAPRLDYAVNFPCTGVWYVWLRGKGQHLLIPVNANLRAGLDGVPTMMAGNGVTGWNETNWSWITDQYDGRMQVTVSDAGPHAFSLWLDRPDANTAIDSILLTSNAAFDIAPRSMVWSNEVNCAGLPNPMPDVCLWPPPRESTLDTRLRLRPVGATWELSWPPGGVLQATTNISHTAIYYPPLWQDLPNASSPFLLTNRPTRFYRVKFFDYQ